MCLIVASLLLAVHSAPREILLDALQGKADQGELVQTSGHEVNLTQVEVFQGEMPKDDGLQGKAGHGVKSQGQPAQVETVQSEQPQVSISSTFYIHPFHTKVLFKAFL